MSVYKRFNYAVFAAIVSFLTACASTKIELRTEPAGAQVQTLEGERLGETPMTLDPAALAKVSKGGRIAVRLVHPEYYTREFVTDSGGYQVHDFKLSAHAKGDFQKEVLEVFPQQVNEMQRELLRIQGLVIFKKYDEAEAALSKHQERFPNVASSYVLRASIAHARKDIKQARLYLLRAQAIDPEDPAVVRMLGLGKKATP